MVVIGVLASACFFYFALFICLSVCLFACVYVRFPYMYIASYYCILVLYSLTVYVYIYITRVRAGAREHIHSKYGAGVL